MKDIFLKLMFNKMRIYIENLHDLHNNLPFLPERMKIEKAEKLIANLQAHVLVLRKVHRVIEFNQKAWIKQYIDMNTELRKKAENDFEKDSFKLKNNSVFRETMENVRQNRDIKTVTTERRRNYLVPELNYHTTKFFAENLLAIEMKKTQILMNKPVFLGLTILELSKTVMYEFWYHYLKPKYGEKEKLCYMNTDCFIIYIKIDDIFKKNAQDTKDVETRFDTSNYEFNRSLPKGNNKKVIGLMKDESG